MYFQLSLSRVEEKKLLGDTKPTEAIILHTVEKCNLHTVLKLTIYLSQSHDNILHKRMSENMLALSLETFHKFMRSTKWLGQA